MQYLIKIKKIFRKYPNDYIGPWMFRAGSKINNADSKDVLSMQLLPDVFFFLIFGLVAAKLKKTNSIRVEGLVVGSVNAAIGTGAKAELMRLPWISYLRIAPWVRAYGDLLDGIAYRCAAWHAPAQMWKDWRMAAKMQVILTGLPTPRKFKIDGIEVADLIVDSYLRFKPSPEFDAKNKFVQRLIWQAIRDVRRAKEYFEKVRPKWYLTSYTTYLEHGIPVRVAMQAGVQVVSFGNLVQFCKKHDIKDWFHTPDFSKYKEYFDLQVNQQEAIDDARNLLEFRMSGGVDHATSYMKESAYKKSTEMLPNELKGAVVIFLHDFYDSPHVYPNLIFDDFWVWINTTIEILEDANIKYYVKPHPNQISLSDEVIIRLKRERPNLRWLNANANNVQLAHVGIVGGVTAYGTVAHELAYLGVPSVSCALHPHHAFNFSKTANTINQYEKYLKELPNRIFDKEVIKKEALMFFWVNNFNQSECMREHLNLKVKLWRECQLQDSNLSKLMADLDSILNLDEIFK